MAKNVEYNIRIDELVAMLDLGAVVEKPKQVFGGLLHKSFDVVTSEGHYFIKALNPQIMLRPTAMRNHLFADEVSIITVNAGLSASAVKKIQGKTIHSFDGQYYQVFEWLDGLSYTHRAENLVECYKIGVVLGQLHQIDFCSLNSSGMMVEEHRRTDWEGILKKADEPALIKRLEDIDIDYIASAELEAIEALKLLEHMVVSHRDLDPKNVMWDKDRDPIVIDWEAAGYVNPTFEMIEVAIYWAESDDGSINPEAFLEVIKGYQSLCEINVEEITHVWSAVNINKIGWIEYNLKRSVGVETNSEEEREVGYQQVTDTINLMKKLDEQIETLKSSYAAL